MSQRMRFLILEMIYKNDNPPNSRSEEIAIMTDSTYEASADNYTITVKTVRSIVEEFLDKYNRSLLGSKEAEQLIKELQDLNN